MTELHYEILTRLFIVLFYIASSIWVFFDARRIKRLTGSDKVKPMAWLFGCLVFWIIAFPFYMYNPTRATRFVLELKDAVTKLQVHLGMGRAGRVPGTRELVLHKNYIAIYRVRGDDVEILRLHYVARNL